MKPRLFVALAALLVLGTIVVALPAPPVRAEDDAAAALLAGPENAEDGFVRFDLPGHRVTYDDTVSSEVRAESSVTKIAFGRVTTVRIVSTASGTYSTDALVSRHVRYPGITVEAKAARGETSGGIVSVWRTGFGWIGVPLSGAGSFAVLTRTGNGGRVLVTEDGTCVLRRDAVFC